MLISRRICIKWSTLSVALVGSAGAQLVSYDGFGDYSAGAQVESGSNGPSGTGINGGIGWGGAYDVSNSIKSLVKIEDRTATPINYSAGEVVIAGGNRALRFDSIANGAYAVRRPLGTSFSAAAGEALWFSVLFRTNNASPLPDRDTFQIGFDDAAGTNNPRVSIGATTTSTDSPATFHFFARTTTSAEASVFHDTLPIAAVTTYFLVGCISPDGGGYNTVSLWVNPSTIDDPGPESASATLASGLSTLSYAFIRTVNLDSGDVYVLDEWRIGRDYGSVAQSLRNALRISPASGPGDAPELRWSALLTGVILETSTTLAPASWTEVTGPFTLSAGEQHYAVPAGPGIPRNFYRLRR